MATGDATLVKNLVDAIEQVESHAPEFAAALAAIRDGLEGPLRLVVSGRVSSGKSTLVNALLGQRVAPTDVSECTQVVTWFRYGYPQRLEVHLQDGTSLERRLDRQGRLPSDLGVDVRTVDHIDAWLTNDALRLFTLVDTPGFSSGSQAGQVDHDLDRAMDASSRAAAARCDAMLFVLNQNLRRDELDVLRAFQEDQARPLSAVNALGVLTKADKLGGGHTDPWQAASMLAKRYAENHADDVADVIPLIGLLAESSECALIGEGDVDDLAALGALPESELDGLLLSADRFRMSDSEVPPEVRERLLGMLDLHGAARAVTLVRDGANSAGRLRAELAATSGITELRARLLDSFANRATPLRLLTALASITKLSYSQGMSGADARLLRNAVEGVRLDPRMHVLREMEAWQACCRDNVIDRDDLVDDLRRLALSSDPAVRLGALESEPGVLRSCAVAAAARWRQFRLVASPGQHDVARVALRSYQLAVAEIDRDTKGGAQ